MSSTAIAAASLTVAASAQHTADVAVCKQTLSAFNPDGASVSAMQAYAKCVEMIYPEDMSDEFRLFLKITILFFFGGIIWGLIQARLTGDDLFGCTIAALLFGILCGVIPFVLSGIVYAAMFLFS